MKKYISIIATAIFLLTSCIGDFEPDAQLIVPGDVIRIELKTKYNTQLTRSTATDDEKVIHNAFVYVFNSSGSKVYAGYHPNLTGSGTTATDEIAITKYNVDPKGMTVAVITNVGEENQVSEVSTADLLAVQSLDALRNLKVFKDDNLSLSSMLERGDMFVMYGEAALVSGTTTVPVERIDAKVKFNITVGTPDDSKKISGLRFYPSQWRVCKVPIASFLFNTDKTETDAGGDGAYADTPQWYNFESVVNGGSEGSYIIAGDGNQAMFEFYVPESIKSAAIGDVYNKRDKRNSDGSFAYAPVNATYVEFSGVVEYNKINDDENLESIMANALFTVHLGGLDQSEFGKANPTFNWNNFSSYGNTHYTYNIQILGAEDILANVNGDGNSGVSGEHTVTEFNKSVDAYNNVFNIELEREKLGDIKWYVKTPFSYGFSNDANPPKDYKWIHFLFRDDITNDDFMTYPGSTKVYSDVVTDENVAAFYTKYIANKDSFMLNVDQLTKVLAYAKDIAGSPLFRQDSDKDGNLVDKAHFTIFVDDYYYEEDPNDGSSGKMLWQKFANAQSRLLNITSLYRKSTDTQSVSMTSMYNITQNSIQTMYNTAPLDAGETEYTAFGSQFYPLSKPGSLEEDADFSVKGDKGVPRLIGTNSEGLPSTDNDEFNGRKNYIELLRHLNSGNITGALPRWDKYIDPATWTLNDDYDYPMFRPLLMNRDTDGDGNIAPEEIQWYLASLSQLVDLWVGEDSFNNVSKLYLHNDWSGTHQGQQHYISSTIKDRDGIWVLWSAEGAAIGPYGDADVGGAWYNSGASKLYYRVVRNLGIPRTSTDAPDRIGHRRKEGDHTYIIMNRLSPLSIRPSLTTGKQATHTERSETNRPYKKFEINTTVYKDGATYNFNEAQGLNDFGEWRIPNQRELILMMSIPAEAGNSADTFNLDNGGSAMSATKFGWNPGSRPGFFKSYDNRLSLFSNNYNEAQIYLVKDVAN